MKVIVLGSSGMLGSTVMNHFIDCGYDVTGSIRSGEFIKENVFVFDPTASSTWKNFPKDADYVVNAIGIIKPFMLDNIKDSIYINAIFPHILADRCKTFGSKLIHITTDCVYSGRDGGYNEDALHDALDDYGKSKSLGEPKNCMVIRTSIIGPEIHKNASLVSWVQAQKGKEINGFTNHLWNGITTKTYAEVCHKIIKNDWYNDDLYHVHAPSIVTKFELVTMINNRYNVGATINPIPAGVRIDRTLSTKKDLCEKLMIPELDDQIAQM